MLLCKIEIGIHTERHTRDTQTRQREEHRDTRRDRHRDIQGDLYTNVVRTGTSLTVLLD